MEPRLVQLYLKSCSGQSWNKQPWVEMKPGDSISIYWRDGCNELFGFHPYSCSALGSVLQNLHYWDANRCQFLRLLGEQIKVNTSAGSCVSYATIIFNFIILLPDFYISTVYMAHSFVWKLFLLFTVNKNLLTPHPLFSMDLCHQCYPCLSTMAWLALWKATYLMPRAGWHSRKLSWKMSFIPSLSLPPRPSKDTFVQSVRMAHELYSTTEGSGKWGKAALPWVWIVASTLLKS